MFQLLVAGRLRQQQQQLQCVECQQRWQHQQQQCQQYEWCPPDLLKPWCNCGSAGQGGGRGGGSLSARTKQQSLLRLVVMTAGLSGGQQEFLFMFIDENWGDNPDQYVPGPMDNVINPNKLHESFIKCKKFVNWKNSVQRYGLSELTNINNIIESMTNGTYQLGEPYEFILNERGHNRYIKALSIMDRVIQRSFNDNVLTPAIQPYLIYDNGASQKGKGIAFSRERFKKHLREAYFEYNGDAYIMFIDFSKYFDNILHEELLKQFQPLMTPEEYEFLCITFHSFDVDISYLSEEEIHNFKDIMFNMLEYCQVDKQLLTGQVMYPKSVGIGNQTSQASGIFYPHKMDNYCKIVKGIKYYGRYMDDTYIIMKTKEELRALLSEIEQICNELGIHINPKKTRIQPIKSELSYLKINYRIFDSGRIFQIVPNHIFAREKHNIDKFHALYITGRMPITDAIQCFLSWEGSYAKFDSRNKVYAMECYFKDKFGIMRSEDLHEILHYLIKWETEEANNPAKLKMF